MPVLHQDCLANSPRLVAPIFHLQNLCLRQQREGGIEAVRIAGSDLLISSDRFILFAHRFQICRYAHPRGACQLVLRKLLKEALEGGIGIGNLAAFALRISKQQIRRCCGRRVAISIDNLLIIRWVFGGGKRN